MPRRHVFRHVVHAAGSRPSGRLLDRALIARGYSGPLINWGNASPRFGDGHPPRDGVMINTPNAVALASNKRIALGTLRAAGVPCPERCDGVANERYPQVWRSDRHRAGAGFWLCHSEHEAEAALLHGATHGMEYIANAREFRVHIVNDQSIKLTEKLYDMEHDNANWRSTIAPQVRSHANGWHHMGPQPDAHRVSLRRVAKDAVRALGLDFGAVDVLMRDHTLQGGVPYRHAPEFYVLEVNTAPGFEAELDTCDRYADAFVRMSGALSTQRGEST